MDDPILSEEERRTKLPVCPWSGIMCGYYESYSVLWSKFVCIINAIGINTANPCELLVYTEKNVCIFTGTASRKKTNANQDKISTIKDQTSMTPYFIRYTPPPFLIILFNVHIFFTLLERLPALRMIFLLKLL